jgi:hypothetical protein
MLTGEQMDLVDQWRRWWASADDRWRIAPAHMDAVADLLNEVMIRAGEVSLAAVEELAAVEGLDEVEQHELVGAVQAAAGFGTPTERHLQLALRVARMAARPRSVRKAAPVAAHDHG